MAESNKTGQRGNGRRFVVSEKRRIAELALRGESPLRTIAREHGICRNTLCRWMALYRGEPSNAITRPRGRTSATTAMFLPVTMAGAARGSRQASNDGSSVEITFASGTALRIEASSLDVRFICSLIAELRR